MLRGAHHTSPTPPCLPADLFEERTEQPRDVERRSDTVHLYGVDVMSTADCYKYFSDYSPTLVEWINDSSCESGNREALCDM